MKNLAILLSIFIFTNCSSLDSRHNDKLFSNEKGLTYYLPKRDLIVTVTIDATGAVSDVTAETTDPYPDSSKAFILKFKNNIFGKSVIDIGVNEKGLLQTSEITSTSQVSEVFKSIGDLAGTATLMFRKFNEDILTSLPSESEKCITGTNTFILDIPNKDTTFSQNLCGLRVTSKPLTTPNVGLENNQGKITDAWESGIYYRQNFPYRIDVEIPFDRVSAGSTEGKKGGYALYKSHIIFSPNNSPTNMLPIPKSFFSNSVANLTFSEGVPTKYKQDKDGELVALLKIPADILTAYFSAVGTAFTKKSTASTQERTSLSDSVKLEFEKKKTAKCIDYLNKDEMGKYTALNCGE